jgi:hypothetical protein
MICNVACIANWNQIKEEGHNQRFQYCKSTSLPFLMASWTSD